MTRTALIMAGGTGGHIFPGLAVAEALQARGWRIVWMGHPAGMESRIVPARGFTLRGVEFSGVRGKGWRSLSALPWRLARGCWQARSILREERPDVVLGMGGYISFPGGLMAALMRIPMVLHEQNAISGTANRLLARLARRSFSAFPGALADSTWCGNPVGWEIVALPAPAERYAARSGALRVLVLGGSLGARALNEAVPNAIGLMEPERRPVVRHQTGRGHLESVRDAYRQAAVEAETSEFISDMAEAYGWADLVISRAGAMTISELSCAGVPALLVPFPFAIDDHQTLNAKFLVQANAAVLVPQPELSPSALTSLIGQFERRGLLRMAERARERARPDAARIVADACEDVAGSPA